MKARAFITGGLALAFAFAAVAPALAQFNPGYAEQRMSQLFEVMGKNVDQIREPMGEMERWRANIAMWRTVLDHLEDPQNTNMNMLKYTFGVMQTNVNRITQPSERERWDDNVRLWQLTIAYLDNGKSVSLGQFSAALGEMDANVCCIANTSERARWQANHDLWQLLAARIANQTAAKPAS
jgi:hypothetical protein